MPNEKLQELLDRQKALDDKIETVSKSRPANTPSNEQVFGSPFARKGESINSSRGFQFQRLLGFVAGVIEPEQAKIELEVCDRLKKSLGSRGFLPQEKRGVLAPLGTAYFGADDIDEQFRHELKSLTCAGVEGMSRDEMAWSMQKAYGGNLKTAQSWLDSSLGGSLVAPPEFGELIELLRNRDAMINAGCRVIPLPSSGRIRYPRQTGPTTAYHVGENTAGTASNYNTGNLVLSAKKLIALVTLPNELIRFASPATEALLRADLTKTLSLQLDYDCLYGEGSDNVILGVINTPGVATVTPTTVATNGNSMSPQDLMLFPSAVEENNGEFQGWIIRPQYFYNFVSARAGVYNGSGVSNYGQFVYDQFRQLGDGFNKVLAGFPAVTTPQVSITRVKSSGTNLTSLFGGQWDDCLLAMFASIEFAEATQGDTAFANDQTVVRAILTADFGIRHPGVIAVADQLTLTLGS
jgi:HK97 family phage major capsid protein